MDLPGGRPTQELEDAVRLLAEGADTPLVLREVLRVAVKQTHGVQGLILARAGDHVIDVAVHGAVDPCLRAATAEALAKGTGFRRSNPVLALNAGAVPVVSAGKVIAALGVAGPADQLDPRPLDTAGALISICWAREGMLSVSSVPFEALTVVPEADDRRGVIAAAVRVLERFTTGPAFVCLSEDGRLRVERYRSIDRDELGRLVSSPGFLDLVGKWRDRPLPSPAAEAIALDGHWMLACAPLQPATGAGLVGVVIAPEDTPAALRLLGALGPHISAALDRVAGDVELQRRDREVDGVVQATPVPVVVLDAAGCFLRMNAAACEVFGLSGSFDSGRPARGRLGSAELEALALDAEGPGEVEVELGTTLRAFRVVVTRVHDGPERLRTVLVLEDVSARRRHEQAHEDFISVIGHELRTPLTVAKGFLETVLGWSEQLDDERRDEFLRTAHAQMERLEDLINDLLFISTERPRTGVCLEETDVLAVAETVVARFAGRHPDREIDCFGLGGDMSASIDQRLAAHALRHLVDNAIKYSDGPVRVEVSSDASSLEIAVVDQGPGIFSGDLERLFLPFEQRDSSSTRRHGGTGLGLFLARRLVEVLGGRLDCDSRLGQGSRFSFRIPRRMASPSRPTAGRPRTEVSEEARDDAHS